ncbi:MAG TPA: hypothetical protein VJX71_04945 [Methylomirabilota bacterium]|nr:hypothetical protein [Methylomirabilota bacterium]
MWQIRSARLWSAGATAGAGLVALIASFTDAGLVVGLAFVLRVAALSGLITTAWLVGTSLPGQRGRSRITSGQTSWCEIRPCSISRWRSGGA